MWESRALAAMSALLLLGACTDPMGASDAISPVAGHAPRANVQAHTVDPNAGHRATANPGGDGQRAVGVIDSYRRAGPTAAEGGSSAGGTGGEE